MAAVFKSSNHGSGDDKKYVCPENKNFDIEAPDPFVGNLSFYHFNMLLSGVCTALVCLIIFSLMVQHATHLSKPKEQTKIMKIALLLPLYTITAFLCICFPHSAASLEPWLEFYQGIALGAFFLLLCEFIAGDTQNPVELFFAAFDPPQKKGKPRVTGLNWFRKQWILIFQYPLVALIVAIATDITQAAGVYCIESNNVHFAHIWLTIIGLISTGMAVISILVFYKGLKPYLAGHNPLTKLCAFKLIVGITLAEQIIFTILRSTNTLVPSSTLSYGDVHTGIQNLVICLQMVAFAIFFPYAYTTAEYKDAGPYQGAGKAWMGMLNPMEIVRAIIFAFTMGMELRKRNAGRVDVEIPAGPQGYGYGQGEYVPVPGQIHAHDGQGPTPVPAYEYDTTTRTAMGAVPGYGGGEMGPDTSYARLLDERKYQG